tara:strand:- start:1508 stop:1789 length:282 start_codon:yes stop_codon:yes gene_type:complete
MASGLALISGVLSIEEPGLGMIVPFIGLILLGLSGPTGRGEGPLSAWFPNENEGEMAGRVEAELSRSAVDEDVGDAWAKLEHSMLSKELEEEE